MRTVDIDDRNIKLLEQLVVDLEEQIELMNRLRMDIVSNMYKDKRFSREDREKFEDVFEKIRIDIIRNKSKIKYWTNKKKKSEELKERLNELMKVEFDLTFVDLSFTEEYTSLKEKIKQLDDFKIYILHNALKATKFLFEDK